MTISGLGDQEMNKQALPTHGRNDKQWAEMRFKP